MVSFHSTWCKNDRFQSMMKPNVWHPLELKRMEGDPDGAKADYATKHSVGEQVKMRKIEGRNYFERRIRHKA